MRTRQDESGHKKRFAAFNPKTERRTEAKYSTTDNRKAIVTLRRLVRIQGQLPVESTTTICAGCMCFRAGDAILIEPRSRIPSDDRIRLLAVKDAVRIRIRSENDRDIVVRLGVQLQGESEEPIIRIARIEDDIRRSLRIGIRGQVRRVKRERLCPGQGGQNQHPDKDRISSGYKRILHVTYYNRSRRNKPSQAATKRVRFSSQMESAKISCGIKRCCDAAS